MSRCLDCEIYLARAEEAERHGQAVEQSLIQAEQRAIEAERQHLECDDFQRMATERFGHLRSAIDLAKDLWGTVPEEAFPKIEARAALSQAEPQEEMQG